jgi:hypothetical protein
MQTLPSQSILIIENVLIGQNRQGLREGNIEFLIEIPHRGLDFEDWEALTRDDFDC